MWACLGLAALLVAAANPGNDRTDAGAPSSGDLDPAAVARGIRQQLGRVKACYERELGLNPWVQGKATAVWTIANDGTVHGVHWEWDDFRDPLFTRCLRLILESLQFPRPTAPTDVSFPFVFRSDDTPPPPAAASPQASTPRDVARDWLNALRRADRVALSRLSKIPFAVTGLHTPRGPDRAACGSPARADTVAASAPGSTDLDAGMTCLLSDAGLRWAIPKAAPDGTWPEVPSRNQTAGRLEVVTAARVADRLARHPEAFTPGANRLLVKAVISSDQGALLSILIALESDGRAPPRVTGAAIDDRAAPPVAPAPISPDR